MGRADQSRPPPKGNRLSKPTVSPHPAAVCRGEFSARPKRRRMLRPVWCWRIDWSDSPTSTRRRIRSPRPAEYVSRRRHPRRGKEDRGRLGLGQFSVRPDYQRVQLVALLERIIGRVVDGPKVFSGGVDGELEILRGRAGGGRGAGANGRTLEIKFLDQRRLQRVGQPSRR